MPSVPINVSTAGDNTVIAAPAGSLYVRTFALVLTASAPVTVTWKDSTINLLSGAVSLIAGKPWIHTFEHGVFDSRPSKGLVLNLSANVSVTGFVTYVFQGHQGIATGGFFLLQDGTSRLLLQDNTNRLLLQGL